MQNRHALKGADRSHYRNYPVWQISNSICSWYWKQQYRLSCRTSQAECLSGYQMYPQNSWYDNFTMSGSCASEKSKSPRNSCHLWYRRGFGIYLYDWRIYSGGITGHVCAPSGQTLTGAGYKNRHWIMRYFRVSPSVSAISHPISGFKTGAYYIMWKYNEINRFWHCFFFYRF